MKKIIVGLVGTSGSGKNEAAACFSKYDAALIDADCVAKKILDAHQSEIIGMFESVCPAVKNSDGSLNKKVLAAFLFSHKDDLRRHEKFMLPLIEKEIRSFLRTTPQKLIVLNAPTLHKTDLINDVDCFIYVTAAFWIRAVRVHKRDSLSLKDTLLRFKNQKNFFSAYKKTEKKTYVIKNNGSKKNLQKKIDTVVHDLFLHKESFPS